MPVLYIITGSNGAGKSSTGANYLPHYIRKHCSIFDGDKLFMSKQRELWQSGITAIKEAKKLALAYVEETFNKLVENSIAKQSDFVYEGHFTNEATWDIPRRFKIAGFSIHLIFLGLADTNLSELRVVDRANEGGHYVDPQTVSDNFYGNLIKLDEHFGMFDSVQIIDTSGLKHKLLAKLKNGVMEFVVKRHVLPHWFIENLSRITAIFGFE